MKELFKALKNIYSENQIFENESMRNHTSFKIGGDADILVMPENQDQIEKSLAICRKEGYQYFVMGNGSNLLVSDKGIRGLVIKIGKNYGSASADGDLIYAQSGILLSTLSKFAAENSLSGMEFASGIPGTLGGAVIMNAGAYGGEMKDIIEEVKFLSSKGEIITYKNDQMKFQYRKSALSDSDSIILGASLRLKKSNKKEIQELMDDFTGKRNSKQPINLPSAGSTFKRPEGSFAGKLIEDSGLKGLRHGDAMVSPKHCGFVVNIGNASAEEVKELIETIQKIVFDNYNIKLETEVKMVGED